MLPEDLPHCKCKEANWQPHGGSFGGVLNQSHFKCGTCFRFASFLTHSGGNLLVIGHIPGEGLSEAVVDWLNGTMLTVWRDNHRHYKKTIEAQTALLAPNRVPTVRNRAALKLADLGAGGPLAMAVFPLLADPGVVSGRETLLTALAHTVGQWQPDWKRRVSDPDTEFGMMDAPDAIDRVELLNSFTEDKDRSIVLAAKRVLEKIEVRKAAGKNCWYQEGWPEPPVPPKVPTQGVTAFVLRRTDHGQVWDYINPRKTQDLPVPVDPIRLDHDEYFSTVFAQAGIASSPREIPNRYYSDKYKHEPWYEMEINGFKLVIGPRKRVISLSLESEQEFDTTKLHALYQRDQVTYEADGRWHSDKPQAKKVLIHAWNQEKTVEYLTTMLEVAGG